MKELVSGAVLLVDKEEGIDTDVDKSAVLAERDAADRRRRADRRGRTGA